VNKNKIKV